MIKDIRNATGIVGGLFLLPTVLTGHIVPGLMAGAFLGLALGLLVMQLTK